MTVDLGLRAAIIGLGREGSALARYLARHGARVTVSDMKGPDALASAMAELADLDIRYVLGGHPAEVFDVDVMFVSPGVPSDSAVVLEARRRGLALSSETRLFTHLCAAPVIGITGSSGKTTTVTLTGMMLAEAGLCTHVGGNIGRPLIGQVDRIRPGDCVVMELSSFQLEGFDPATPATRAFPPPGWSPRGAAVLNITPNHLDRHPSMDAYVAAKANILRYQKPGDWAVLNADDPIASGLRSMCAGRLLEFSLTGPVPQGAYLDGADLIWKPEPGRQVRVCGVRELRLRGRHNVANVLAACAISGAAGATLEAMAAVATSFTGVEHRLELVRERAGVAYYNDSIATSPERAMAALRSFGEPLVLLAGGRDKHLPWEEWAVLVRERVRELICFGEMAPLLQRVLAEAADGRSAQGGPRVHVCAGMEEAVMLASEVAGPGDVVLLSPGGTSFDAYADYAARGWAFREAVKALS